MIGMELPELHNIYTSQCKRKAQNMTWRTVKGPNKWSIVLQAENRSDTFQADWYQLLAICFTMAMASAYVQEMMCSWLLWLLPCCWICLFHCNVCIFFCNVCEPIYTDIYIISSGKGIIWILCMGWICPLLVWGCFRSFLWAVCFCTQCSYILGTYFPFIKTLLASFHLFI